MFYFIPGKPADISAIALAATALPSLGKRNVKHVFSAHKYSGLHVSVAADESLAEVADTLRVAAMVQEFRRHGHLVAQLDPLRRPARGPWLAEVPTHGSDQRCCCRNTTAD